MKIASLVLGILSLILGFIPGCGLLLASLPAVIGLVLGIIAAVKASKAQEPKGMAIAGIILSVLAFIAIAISTFVIPVIFSDVAMDALEDYEYDYNYYSY